MANLSSVLSSSSHFLSARPYLQITPLYLKDLTLLLSISSFLAYLSEVGRPEELLKGAGAWSLTPSAVFTHQGRGF